MLVAAFVGCVCVCLWGRVLGVGGHTCARVLECGHLTYPVFGAALLSAAVAALRRQLEGQQSRIEGVLRGCWLLLGHSSASWELEGILGKGMRPIIDQ